MSKEIYDPRQALQHKIQVGQVYGHARSKRETDDGVEYDQLYRLVYEDDEKVFLRSNKQYERTGRYHYMAEDRATFEEQAGEGYMKLLEDVEGAPPMPGDGIVAALKIAKRHRETYKHRLNNGSGRVDKHKVAALDELIDELMEMNPTEIDWETLDGVGEKTAQSLNDAGIRTDADVLAVSDEQLLSVDGVGEGNLQSIREAAE